MTEGELARLVRRRRMTRAFDGESLDDETLASLLDLARRAPSAGNTMAIEFLVLSGAEQTGRYWETTGAFRDDFAWPGLRDAPVLVMLWTRPDAYVERYRDPDKARTGLGLSSDAWSVPYWFVDGGAAAMTMLLAAEDAGLGALLFGVFEHEGALRQAFGVPKDRRCIGVIALGRRAPHRLSRSARRAMPEMTEIVHRGSWRDAP